MADKYVAYVGTYTRGESKGLYILDLDAQTAKMSIRDVIPAHNPSNLTLSLDNRFLYSSCDEGVTAYKIEEDGSLTLLNKASINGLRPRYVSVDSQNRYLLTAGYHDGKLTVLKLNEDGSVGEVTDEVFMKGMGNVSSLHYRAHVNSARFSMNDKFIICVDLGANQIKTYDFDFETGKLDLKDILRCDLESGPKHVKFTSDGKFAFVTFEYSNNVIMYSFDVDTGHFEELKRLKTIPDEWEDINSTITLKVTDDDKHLLVCNSGDNSVALYNIDKENKDMTLSCILPVSGEYPRGIAVMPSGDVFATVNMEGNSITTFKINYEKNYFLMNNKPLKIPSPTSICYRKL